MLLNPTGCPSTLPRLEALQVLAQPRCLQAVQLGLPGTPKLSLVSNTEVLILAVCKKGPERHSSKVLRIMTGNFRSCAIMELLLARSAHM